MHHCTQVLSGDDERVATCCQLAQSWQAMWLRWDSQQDSRREESQADVDEEQRMAFVKSLVAMASIVTNCSAPFRSHLSLGTKPVCQRRC